MMQHLHNAKRFDRLKLKHLNEADTRRGIMSMSEPRSWSQIHKRLRNRNSMAAAALGANVALMCWSVSPEVLLGPLCLPKRQYLSPLNFLHGERMNTANQYGE